ncbi:P-type DNA transfer protein VirB5 [Microvirga puerhi]|uniref:P-type DNA transfer protein VirB5 n=1 Tax=Microvirga puerhi TaxID=2876078 RepID=A0ABS7VUW5_9HYPH|nr:P-type DNA transfer protein VirB5 [Microvirga puerhi]MBZ6078840.1 P-type DNA transfer protein VirB5 [Microvirga puerhi]
MIASSALIAWLAFQPAAVDAQGIPVFDASAISNQLQQLQSMAQQLDKLQEQLQQAEKLYGSFNKLTDISSLGSILNDPQIRQALPKEFSQVEDLLKGNGDGIFGNLTSHFQSANRSYESPADTFYAQELARNNKQIAGTQSLGQAMYDAASKRMEGLETLKQRLGTASDAKESMDLQTRFSSEMAFLQTDILRMSALKMVQDAQAEVMKQRQAEQAQKITDGFANGGSSSATQ